MKKIVVIMIGALMLVLSGCCLKHEYTEATCTQPRTCVKCGKTEGAPLGHTWVEATCIQPKTCSVCGATVGEPLPHEPGEWEVEAVDCASGMQTMSVKCEVCGETIESKTEAMTTFVDGDHFMLTMKEFAERFENSFNNIYANIPVTLEFIEEENGYVEVDVFNANHYNLAEIVFLDKNGEWLSGSQEDSQNIYSIIALTGSGAEENMEDDYTFFQMLVKTISMSVDPTMDYVNTTLNQEELMNNAYDGSSGSGLNGITYSCGLTGQNYFCCEVKAA